MRFDDQAAAFERRAGLPDAVMGGINAALAAMVRFRGRGVLLEVGVGTGSLGSRLRDLPWHYLGFDLSRPMLRQAGLRFQPGGKGVLLQADGRAAWPLADGTVEVVFGSRALHLMGPAHVVAEAIRVGSPAGVALILGSIRRDPGSVKGALQREMRRLLGERGYAGPGGGQGKREILELGRRAGGRSLPTVAVAEWTAAHSPQESLASWRGKDGLDGLAVPEDVKREVLDALQDWMLGHFPDPGRPRQEAETYVLDGVELRAAA